MTDDVYMADDMLLFKIEVQAARNEATAARVEAAAALADVRAVRHELGMLLDWVRELKSQLNPPP